LGAIFDINVLKTIFVTPLLWDSYVDPYVYIADFDFFDEKPLKMY